MEAGQAMQEFAVRIAGFGHHFRIHAVGLKQLYALGKLVLFAHGYPNVGIYNVRALHVVYVFGKRYGSAGGLCDLLHLVHKLLAREKLLRRKANEVHAHLCRAYHKGIAHVVARIARVYELNLVQRLMHMLLYGQKVGQYLRGVIKIRKAVPYGHAAVFCQQLNIALLKAAELNAVIEAAEHLRRVLKGFLFAHLAV